jgi:hypothetical protein
MIDDLKKLDKFLSTCAKYGVTSVSWGGVTCTMGPMPLTVEQIKEANTPEPTDEEMAFYAVDGA